MKQLSIFGALVLALILSAGVGLQARAAVAPAYCGPASDTAAVQNLWVKAHATGAYPLNVSYVMSIIVSGNYAQLMFESKGQANAYYLKQGTTWHSVGYFAPKSWPKAVITKFNNVVNGWGQGNKPCMNPRFVNHPSGP
jgi:hypothetical protein